MSEIVLALDVDSRETAFRLLDKLPDLRWVKLGPILFTREGPQLARELADRGLRVFLDLKWHDIPHTVAQAVIAARELSVAMATVHTLGGSLMLQAAAEAAGTDLAVVGVTVLTSHDSESYAKATGRDEVDLLKEVERQAVTAVRSGLAGVVCSPREAAVVRRAIGPRPLIVVPAIRRSSDPAGDQARTASPKEAVLAGATHLVVGRPVLNAPDPGLAFRELCEAVP